jgi:hypothetical protein
VAGMEVETYRRSPASTYIPRRGDKRYQRKQVVG